MCSLETLHWGVKSMRFGVGLEYIVHKNLDNVSLSILLESSSSWQSIFVLTGGVAFAYSINHLGHLDRI